MLIGLNWISQKYMLVQPLTLRKVLDNTGIKVLYTKQVNTLF